MAWRPGPCWLLAGMIATSVAVSGCGGSAPSTGTAGAASGRTRFVYRAFLAPGVGQSSAATAETVKIVERRARALGLRSGLQAHSQGNLIILDLPGTGPATRAAAQAIAQTGRLAFYDWEANVLTPSGKPAAALLQAQNPSALRLSQGLPYEPGSAGAGALPLYQAVTLAAAQREQTSSDNGRSGPEYFAFGAPNSPACRAAARYYHVPPLIGRHCYLAGPLATAREVRAALPAGVAPSDATVVSVKRGWTVLQAVPSSFTAAPGWSTVGPDFFVLRDRVAVPGSEIVDPRPGRDGAGTNDVNFGFTPAGASEFQHVTGQVARRGLFMSGLGQTLNQHFAVALDSQLISVPYIDFKQFPNGIPGENGADVAGGFTAASARALASQLQYGALPLTLKLIAVKPS